MSTNDSVARLLFLANQKLMRVLVDSIYLLSIDMMPNIE